MPQHPGDGLVYKIEPAEDDRDGTPYVLVHFKGNDSAHKFCIGARAALLFAQAMKRAAEEAIIGRRRK